MSQYPYDPQNGILVVDGYRVTQFAEGTYITIEPTDDDFKAYHGVKSETWVRQKNKGFKLTFSVPADSADNAHLSLRLRLQKAGPTPAFSTLFREINGTSYAKGNRCRFTKPPKLERSTEMPKVEYVVEALTGEVQCGMML